MNKLSAAVAAVALIAVPAQLEAKSAEIGAVANFKGVCRHIHDEQTKPCNDTVADLRFTDGYDSIQFQEGNSVTAFVGKTWKDNSGPNRMLPDNALFMPLEQVILSNKATGKMDSLRPQGQCVLLFKTSAKHDVQSVTKIWCEYSKIIEGSGGHALWLGELTEDSVTIVEGQSKAAVRGYGYYK